MATAFQYGALIAPAILAGLTSAGMAYYSGQSDHKQRNNLYKTFTLYGFAAAALCVYGVFIWLGLGDWTDAASVTLPLWWWMVTAVVSGLHVLNTLRHGGRYELRQGTSKHPMDGTEYDIPTYAWSAAACFAISFLFVGLAMLNSTTTGLGLGLGLIALAFQLFSLSGFITAWRRYGINGERVREKDEDAAKLYNWKSFSLGLWIVFWASLDLAFILGPNVSAVLDNSQVSIWLLVMNMVILAFFGIEYCIYDVKKNAVSGMYPTFDSSGANQFMQALAMLSNASNGKGGFPGLSLGDFGQAMQQQQQMQPQQQQAAPMKAAAAPNPFGQMGRNKHSSKQH